MKELSVQTGRGSYPIYIGSGLLDDPDLLRMHLSEGPHTIVTNTHVEPLYADRVENMLGGEPGPVIAIPDGEEHKTLDTFNDIITRLLECGAHRRSTLLALGGGVVGDITGFVAASYRRGAPFIQIPTTLLAQVDSSVGGKTGVNHPLGKNMIGAFYQPEAVVIDTDTLTTLSERHYLAGLAEVVKYGLIADASFFDFIDESLDALRAREPRALHIAIERSCLIKADFVARDERETSGARMLLNLGHTFGHALEALLGYGQWLHGEAVACGIVMAAHFSNARNLLDPDEVDRITNLLERAGLPVAPPPGLDPGEMLAAMARDKKNVGDRQALVLLARIGEAFVDEDCDTQFLLEFLADALNT